MALTKIKLDSMVTGTLPDANIPDDITITGLSGTNSGDNAVNTNYSGLAVTSTSVTDGTNTFNKATDFVSATSGGTFGGAVTMGSLTSTGIDDNATSTAITIDSSEKTTFANSLLSSTSNFDIIQGTSDESDNRRTRIGGGGDVSHTRGGYIELAGNEHTNTGQVILNAGDVTGGDIILKTSNSPRMTIDEDGNATFAGDLEVDGGALTVDKSISAGDLNTAPIVTFKNSLGSGHYTAIKFEGADGSGANTGFLGYMSHNTSATRRFVFSHDGTTRDLAINGDGSATFTGNITQEGGADRTILSQVSGDYFPRLQIERIDGGNKVDRKWSFDIGTNGSLFVEDKTEPRSVMEINTDGDTTFSGELTVEHNARFENDVYFESDCFFNYVEVDGGEIYSGHIESGTILITEEAEFDTLECGSDATFSGETYFEDAVTCSDGISNSSLLWWRTYTGTTNSTSAAKLVVSLGSTLMAKSCGMTFRIASSNSNPHAYGAGNASSVVGDADIWCSLHNDGECYIYVGSGYYSQTYKVCIFFTDV